MSHTRDMHWIATDFGGLEEWRFVETDVRPPGPGDVTIEVRAAGVNPADWKHVTRGGDRSVLPILIPIGYEVSGVITAIGDNTRIASGGGAIGDEVMAFRTRGGYATSLTLPAKDVYAKPVSLEWGAAANLLLAGTTASEMLHVTGVTARETVLVHGASGAVGVSLMQQAALIGVRVIGTASEENFDVVRRFGGEPVRYGDGLEQRVRELALRGSDGPGGSDGLRAGHRLSGIDASLDCVGTDEAVAVSLAVSDLSRVVTIAAFAAAHELGFTVIAGNMPASAAYRDGIRGHLIDLAGRGKLAVPVARSFPLSEAISALELLQTEHPGGKLVLVP